MDLNHVNKYIIQKDKMLMSSAFKNVDYLSPYRNIFISGASVDSPS